MEGQPVRRRLPAADAAGAGTAPETPLGALFATSSAPAAQKPPAALPRPSPLPPVLLLSLCLLWAVLLRLHSVTRWGPIIHENDPHFNYRATEYLSAHGWGAFLRWTDPHVWVPLGRDVGGSTYPGLMLAAVGAHRALAALGFPVDLKTVCVFLPPVFASLLVLPTAWLAAQAGGTGAGLFAAALVAGAPAFLARSVAGAFDNEAVALVFLVGALAAWVKAAGLLLMIGNDAGLASLRGVRRAVLCAVLAGACYTALAVCWGGYVIALNLIPLHALAMIAVAATRAEPAAGAVVGAASRACVRLLLPYGVVYATAHTLPRAIVPYIGNRGFDVSGEALLSHAALCVLLAGAASAAAGRGRAWAGVPVLVAAAAAALQVGGGGAFAARTLSALLARRSSESSLVASVGEHQPAVWSALASDLGFVLPSLSVAGVVLVLLGKGEFGGSAGTERRRRRRRSARVFLVLFMVTSTFFAASMGRLSVLLAPAASVAGGLGASALTRAVVVEGRGASPPHKRGGGGGALLLRTGGVLGLFLLLPVVLLFPLHSAFLARFPFASPALVFARRQGSDGARVIVDDFREAYAWLRHNTPKDAVVAAWWDYGYQVRVCEGDGGDLFDGAAGRRATHTPSRVLPPQISALADRPTVIDGNTWNATHIGLVARLLLDRPGWDDDGGKAEGSSTAGATAPDRAPSSISVSHALAQSLGAQYILVVFGGATGYAGDDLSKQVWMERIAREEEEGGGVGEGEQREPRVARPRTDTLLRRLAYFRVDGECPTGGLTHVGRTRQLTTHDPPYCCPTPHPCCAQSSASTSPLAAAPRRAPTLRSRGWRRPSLRPTGSCGSTRSWGRGERGVGVGEWGGWGAESKKIWNASASTCRLLRAG
jgi:dolichyl-diphosphooligosaccharide---protein glycosyltransferase